MRSHLIAPTAISLLLLSGFVALAQTGSAAAGSVAGPAGGIGVVGTPPPGAAAPSGTDILAPGASGRVPLSELGTPQGKCLAPDVSGASDPTRAPGTTPIAP